jgi:response regulator RpfG family c-di-GMP phosphodiesterase
MTQKILLVDDELLLLESLRRELGFRYDIDTALSGAEGLEKVRSNGPYAVVVSDYRMPKMDGIQFLNQVMEINPDTVRIMLTGNADLETAVNAINQGHIFRFLTKPCAGSPLTSALDAGLRQHQLVMAEKELLENTLSESINMLGEVLSIVNPKAYGRSLRTRQLTAHIVKQLKIKDGWEYEIAAALSQLGWIIFPPRMLDKIENNQVLDAPETLIFARHPLTAGRLLENIPRLERVARIIARHEQSTEDLCLDPSQPEAYFVDLGSHILKVCVEYDDLQMRGLHHDLILERFRSSGRSYHPEVLQALGSLRSYKPVPVPQEVEEIKPDDLDTGMILMDDVKDVSGMIIVQGGTLVTRSVLIHIFSILDNVMLVTPIKVVRTGLTLG